MRRALRVIFPLMLAGMLWTGAVVVQQRLNAAKPSGWFQERMSYLPRGDGMKPYLLGFETTYAQYLWIRTTLYLGGHYLTDKQYPWLIQMVDMVTRLNPRLAPPYEFAGTLFSDLCKDSDASRVILSRGLANVTKDTWKLAFYLGSIYLLAFDDKAAAAEYFELAAHLPGAPVWTLARSAAFFYGAAGKKAQALAFLEMMYQSTEEKSVKQHLAQKIREMQASANH